MQEVTDFPCIAKLPIRFDLDDATLHGTIPPRLRRRGELEFRPGLEGKSGDRQEPLRKQSRLGERSPDLFRRMLQVEFKRQ